MIDLQRNNIVRYAKADRQFLMDIRLRARWLMFVLSLAQILGCAAMPSMSGLAIQPQEHFELAIHHTSTSPFFVRTTIVDGRTGGRRTGCVEAPFLLGAVHREYQLTHYSLNRVRAKQIALENRDRVFRFFSPEALENVRFRYTPEDLNRARVLVGSWGIAPFQTVFPSEARELAGDLQWSGALACALIETGAMASRADISGQVVAVVGGSRADAIPLTGQEAAECIVHFLETWPLAEEANWHMDENRMFGYSPIIEYVDRFRGERRQNAFAVSDQPLTRSYRYELVAANSYLDRRLVEMCDVYPMIAAR